jgi:hypothetical protein
MKQVGKNVTAARNSHATVEELLDACVFVFFHRCKEANQLSLSRGNKQSLEVSCLCAVRVVSTGSRQLVVPRSSWFYFIDYQLSGRGGCTLWPCQYGHLIERTEQVVLGSADRLLSFLYNLII